MLELQEFPAPYLWISHQTNVWSHRLLCIIVKSVDSIYVEITQISNIIMCNSLSTSGSGSILNCLMLPSFCHSVILSFGDILYFFTCIFYVYYHNCHDANWRKKDQVTFPHITYHSSSSGKEISLFLCITAAVYPQCYYSLTQSLVLFLQLRSKCSWKHDRLENGFPLQAPLARY